ncbi:MAG TPA: DNA primase [Candidatus Paceibacterota bacterium]|nr:DNA primase [Candidatus Paceibacterota bacterium]
MNSSVQKIKERLSIVDVVSSYISLEKAGKNYKAKCPFHNEKTPSFFVSPDRGTYYCFGCNAKGDIFSFVEKFEGTDFLGALKILADRAGVDLEEYKNKNKDKTELYYEIMEEATIFFEDNLKAKLEARSYLLSRGLNDQSIEKFRIGFAPDSWSSLINHLKKKDFKTEDILAVGLIKKKDTPDQTQKEDHYYDRFRSRIMFPISDSAGRIIAFSGRIFGQSEDSKDGIVNAKYLNSPETPLFNKSSVLFGLDKAKSSIRNLGYSIVVEGQMDLILSHQSGFTNTVAVSGTAFTDSLVDSQNKINNLGLIKRLSPNIIFAYDGDGAGLRAANRSAAIALSLDMQVKLAVLPIGEDPADIIKKDKEKWKNIIKNSVNIISFHLDKIVEETDDLRKRGHLVKERIFPFLRMINSSIEKNAYINEAHKKTGISETAIIEDYKNYERLNKTEDSFSKKEESIETEKKSRREELEKRFFGVIFSDSLLAIDKDKINDLKDKLEKDIGEDIFKSMLEKYEPFKENLSLLAEIWHGDKEQQLIKDLTEIIFNLEEEIFKDMASVLLVKINQKEHDKDKQKIDEDIINYQKIVEKIEDIKSRRLK